MRRAADRQRRRHLSVRSLAFLMACGGAAAGGFGQATPPAAVRPGARPAALPPGWQEVDQRLVFLTVQLSTIESSIAATDKALVTNGYQKISKEEAAEAARRRNSAMDRMGGGPVPWQEFYGRTAESFFYHPTDGNTIHINPDAVSQRPPQFDYIYRANEENREQAEADAAKVGNKIDDLLAYRRELEAEQSGLWCKIAFRGESSLALSERPLYRLDLTGPANDAGRQSVEAAEACVAFLKAVDQELTSAQKEMDDQKTALDHLSAATVSARVDLRAKLLKLPAFTDVLTNPNDPLGKFLLLAKRAEDSAQNLVDATRLAADADAKDDLAAERRYRGQVQAMAIDYATAVASAHQTLSAAVGLWKVTPTARPGEAVPVKPQDADAVAAKLDGAKATWAAEVTAAKRALVGAVDARLNAAADAGDLNGVQALQSAKVKAATDGTVEASITDPSVLAAKKTMDDSVSASKAKLAAAYRQAVVDLTRARKFPEAMAVQDEFKAANLDQAVPAATAEGTPPPADATAADPSADPAAAEPQFSGETKKVRLAAPAENVVAGGGGRYLIYQLKKLRQLAVLDVNAAKVVKYIDLPAEPIVYAADRDTLIIGEQESGELLTWNLKTMTEGTHTRGIGPQIRSMAMGYDSAGPLLICLEKKTYVLSPASLSHCEAFSWEPPYDGSADDVHFSADGHTAVAYGFPGWAGSRTALFDGTQCVARHSGGYVHENDLLLPPDGGRIFDTGGEGKIFSPDYESETDVDGLPGAPFPSYDSAYFVAYTDKKARRGEGGDGKMKLVIGDASDRHAIITLRDLKELEGSAPVKHYQRVQFIPRANLLVSLGTNGDNVVLRKLDIYKSLDESGIDYLVVTSSAPSSAASGRSLSYQVTVKSSKGNPKYSLQSAPPGMTISATGLVRWSVPTRYKDGSVTVIVDVTDDSKQEVFQTFQLAVGVNSSTSAGKHN